MPGLPSSVYNCCRNIFLRCACFDDIDKLRTVFTTSELYPFRAGLPNKYDSKIDLVDKFICYILDKYLDGRPVLLIFVTTLRDRYETGEKLYNELDKLHKDVQNELYKDIQDEGQKQYQEPYQKAQHETQIEQWFQEANQAWSQGDWETAGVALRRVWQHIDADKGHRYHQLVKDRLKSLANLKALDGRIKRALRQTPYTDLHIEHITTLFAEALQLAPTNQYLNAQDEKWQESRQNWQAQNGQQCLIKDALDRGDWKTASRLLERHFLTTVNNEITELKLRVESVQQAETLLAQAQKYEKEGKEALGLRDVTLAWKQALGLFEQVTALKLSGEQGVQAKTKVEDLTERITELEQASTAYRQARAAKGRRDYPNALEAMQKVCQSVLSHSGLQERFEQERDDLELLCNNQQPFSNSVARADELIKKQDLPGALQALQAAQDYLTRLGQAALGEEKRQLEEVLHQWCEVFIDKLAAAWQPRRLDEMMSLLEQFDAVQASALQPHLSPDDVKQVMDYRRLLTRQQTLKELDTLLRDKDWDAADAKYQELVQRTDSQNMAENRELERWGQRITRAKAVQKAVAMIKDPALSSRVASDPQGVQTPLTDARAALIAVQDDPWFDTDAFAGTQRSIELLLAIALAKVAEQNGDYETAQQQYATALDRDPTSLEAKEARERLTTTLERYGQAQQAFADNNLGAAVNHLKSIPVASQHWAPVAELRRRLLALLESEGEVARNNKNYAEALRDFRWLRQLESADLRYEELYQELLQRLNALQADVARLKLDPDADAYKLEALLVELNAVESHWGLKEAQTLWIPKEKRNLAALQRDIQQAEQQVERAKVALHTAFETGDFNPTQAFLNQVADRLQSRKTVHDIWMQIERKRRAHQAIERARQIYHNSKQNEKANARLMDEIMSYDRDREFRISKEAWAELQQRVEEV